MPFENAEKWMAHPIGDEMSAIEISCLQPVGEPITSGADPTLLCAYNWKKNKNAAIHVPGTAPRWIDRALPVSVPPDRGEFFVDQNRAKNPQHPLEVVFQALAVMKPDYRFNDVDVLVNRNSLRKLFNFCCGRAQRSFRIDLYTVHDTLILERCEKEAVEHLNGTSGYGHNFEKKFTEFPPGLEDSTAHHRVLEYQLGDLKTAVRFEVDVSFVPNGADDAEALSENAAEPVSAVQENIEQLSERLASVRVSPTTSQDIDPRSTPIEVSRSGSVSAQTELAEIKTGHAPMLHILPQMWFGRTNFLIQGQHAEGIFDKIEIRCMEKKLLEWESNPQNQQALCKMAGLLKLIRGEMKRNGNDAAVMIFQRSQPDKLKIYNRKSAKSVLPYWVITTFWTVTKDASKD